MRSHRNGESKKTIIAILSSIVGILLGIVVFCFTDIYMVKLLVSVSVIILSIIIIGRNIINTHSNEV